MYLHFYFSQQLKLDIELVYEYLINKDKRVYWVVLSKDTVIKVINYFLGY